MYFLFSLSLQSLVTDDQILKARHFTAHMDRIYVSDSVFLGDRGDYILKQLSSCNANPCILPSIKGTNVLKDGINELYHQLRKASGNSIILFEDYATKPTITQRVLLKDGNL